MNRRVAVLLATWFGSGRLPGAPGTWGSLATLPLAAVIHASAGMPGLLVAAALTFGVGVWASGAYCRLSGRSDPSEVVIDEVAGQFLALAFLPLTWWAYVIGFAAFRVADIFKPWPANWIDRSLGGGLGVMLDDIVAGFYAAIAGALMVHYLQA